MELEPDFAFNGRFPQLFECTGVDEVAEVGCLDMKSLNQQFSLFLPFHLLNAG